MIDYTWAATPTSVLTDIEVVRRWEAAKALAYELGVLIVARDDCFMAEGGENTNAHPRITFWKVSSLLHYLEVLKEEGTQVMPDDSP